MVDDEPVNREIALMQLEAVDLVVDMAVDGTEAVALAQKNRYAAILMDMQMPKLNGLEATQEIRRLQVLGGMNSMARRTTSAIEPA